MKRYITINKGKITVFNCVNILLIPLYWLYCKIMKYEFNIYERRDLN